MESSSEEEIDVKYIIENKPKPKVVREFFRFNLECIIDEDEEYFNRELEENIM